MEEEGKQCRVVQGYSGTGVQCSGTFEMGTSERFYIVFNEYVE